MFKKILGKYFLKRYVRCMEGLWKDYYVLILGRDQIEVILKRLSVLDDMFNFKCLDEFITLNEFITLLNPSRRMYFPDKDNFDIFLSDICVSGGIKKFKFKKGYRSFN